MAQLVAQFSRHFVGTRKEFQMPKVKKNKKWIVTLQEFYTVVRTFTYHVTETDSPRAIETGWEKRERNKGNVIKNGYPIESWKMYDTDSRAEENK